MNIFRRYFFPNSNESPSSVEENISSGKLKVDSSSMRQPDPGAGTPQSSQRGKAKKDDRAIEILLSSDDENEDIGKENLSATSSITNITHPRISKTTGKSTTVSAELTTVAGLKPTESTLESTKSPSVTPTDTSKVYDDDVDEGKENAVVESRIDKTLKGMMSKVGPDGTVSLAELGNASGLKSRESSLEPKDLHGTTKGNHATVYSARKRRRKRSKDSHDILPSALLLSASPNAACNNNKQRRSKDSSQDLSNQSIRITRGKNYPLSSSPLTSKERNEENPFAFPSETQCEREGNKNGKRPRYEDSTESVSFKNKQINQDSTAAVNDEKPINQYSTPDRLQSPSESNEQLDESPGKVIPEFKLPPELAPFNNPGVCDFGVIRTSRLRNRRKKTDAPEDVLYQNIQGQRRCRATRDGRKMAGAGNANRCLNCAEGVFKFCHTHRELDKDQREFWEQRKRGQKNPNRPSEGKANVATKARPRNSAKPKSSFSGTDIDSTKDLSKNAEQTKPLDEDRDVASMTKMDFSVDKNIKPTEEVAVPREESKDEGLNSQKVRDMHSNFTTNAEKNKSYPDVPTSDSSLAESDEVPKNIEFPRNIDISTAEIEPASSFDDLCFNVYKSKRCWKKRAKGDILCHECRKCHDEGTPFDHILHDDDLRDKRILLANKYKCVKFLKGKQCQKLALEGNILCNDCLQSWDETKKSSFEYLEEYMEQTSEQSSEDSRVSEPEIELDGTNSDGSSSDTYSSDSDDSEDSLVSDDTNYDAYCMAYKHKEFFKMWKKWEKKTEKVDEVEDSRLIKRANNTMNPIDSDGQVKAQYGRVLPHAMKKMIKILELRREDVFLDIGHGVGNTCLHASFCTGCDSRGIEVVSDRHEIADKFRGGMYAEHNCGDPPRPVVGNVDLRLGRLEDPRQKDFLTKGVTRAYVNNFNGVFAERSSKNKDKWFLDDYISGIFASMAPGAIMVTFHPLNLGLDRDSVNSLRAKHNLAESEQASYYESEKILLGQAFCSVKWNKRSGNTNEIYVYKYRRLHQPGHQDAVFLCCNPSCKLATDMVPIPATTQNEDGRCVINHCECKFSPKNLRRRNGK